MDVTYVLARPRGEVMSRAGRHLAA